MLKKFRKVRKAPPATRQEGQRLSINPNKRVIK